MNNERHLLSKEVQQIPLEFHIGGLIVEIINFEYVPPGPTWVVPNHKHSSYEFHYVSQGKGYVTMDDKSFTIVKNEFYITGPNVYHSQVSDKIDPVDECSLQCQIRLDPDAKSFELIEAKYILKLFNQPIRRSFPDTYGGIAVFNRILEEIAAKRIGYVTIIKQLLMELIIASARTLMGDRPSPSIFQPVKDTDHTMVRQCILFMEDNYQDAISLEDIADSIYISPRHLMRIFKTITGKTVMDYLLSQRMERAKQLLENSDLSVEEIAQECGIANGSYLSTLCKKHLGLNPSQYRKQISTK